MCSYFCSRMNIVVRLRFVILATICICQAIGFCPKGEQLRDCEGFLTENQDIIFTKLHDLYDYFRRDGDGICKEVCQNPDEYCFIPMRPDEYRTDEAYGKIIADFVTLSNGIIPSTLDCPLLIEHIVKPMLFASQMSPRLPYPLPDGSVKVMCATFRHFPIVAEMPNELALAYELFSKSDPCEKI